MNTYQITIMYLGQVYKVLEGICANSALEAIERVEQEYDSHPVGIASKTKDDSEVITWYEWTGFEFLAKRMSFVLN